MLWLYQEKPGFCGYIKALPSIRDEGGELSGEFPPAHRPRKPRYRTMLKMKQVFSQCAPQSVRPPIFPKSTCPCALSSPLVERLWCSLQTVEIPRLAKLSIDADSHLVILQRLQVNLERDLCRAVSYQFGRAERRAPREQLYLRASQDRLGANN